MTTSDGGAPAEVAVGRPTPRPDEVSEHYWNEAGAGRLTLRRCTACGRLQYPPEPLCTFCQSGELEPTTLSGRGTLWSFAEVDRAFHPGFVAHTPYVVGLVELEEQEGLRMVTNIVGAGADELTVGLPVEVTFEVRGAVSLPQFRPASTTEVER